MSNKLIELVENSNNILDVGTGPNGSSWYDHVSDDAKVTGIDLYFDPSKKTSNYSLFKMDAMDLDKVDKKRKYRKSFINQFDLLVANHVFEHVAEPERLASGIAKVLMPGGKAFISIPDPDNFTDIFYHLIHPDGGGHVSLIKKKDMIKMMEDNGFELEHYDDIPDDWLWLEKLYDWKNRGIKYFSQEKIKYIADVFRKELSPQKGYYYGGEYIFRKKYI